MTDLLTPPLRAFLEQQQIGVLATATTRGTVRQSLVYYLVDGDQVLISTTSDRGKARDVQRSGRASFCVLGTARPFPSLTVDGPARILSEGVAGPTVRLRERISGQPVTDPPTDADLAAIKRVILAIQIERVYGVSYIDQRAS